MNADTATVMEDQESCTDCVKTVRKEGAVSFGSMLLKNCVVEQYFRDTLYFMDCQNNFLFYWHFFQRCH